MSEKRPPIDLIGRLSEQIANPGRTPPPAPAPAQSEARRPAVTDAAAAAAAAAVPPRPAHALPSADAERAAARRALQPAIEIDLVKLQKEGFLTPQNQRSLIAEEYRIIKRPLLRSAFDRTANNSQFNHVVMVTSPKPGDGKTFTSINLAMSVASERDLYVLLIDCDIRRMDLSKKLGIADRKGIMDVLLDPKLAVADVMLRTNIPNLAVIPSGQPAEAATELFASQSMTKLVDEIASRYQDRFIIFDTPPILASSEPSVLALHVGHVIMVISAGETTKAAVNEALPLVNSCPNVHFILNRASMASGRDRFGYYGQY